MNVIDHLVLIIIIKQDVSVSDSLFTVIVAQLLQYCY